MSTAHHLSTQRPVRHLLLPFAAVLSDAWLATMKELPEGTLRHVHQLLRGMQPVHLDQGEASSLSPPHERALARIHGLEGPELGDGLIPWAAWRRSHELPAEDVATSAWAFVTPCHWSMGREQATLSDIDALDLSEADSRSLLQSMQEYCSADGITLHYMEPHCWLAQGELFRRLPTASLDRVLGRSVDPWLPAARAARALRRLQNEMQMLFYTHPVNALRAARRQLPVNSIWFSGTGDLPEQGRRPPLGPEAQNLSMPRTLATTALAGDWPGYAAAWTALDAGAVKELLTHQRAGALVRLTLCGERSAQTWETLPANLLTRITHLFARRPLLGALETL